MLNTDRGKNEKLRYAARAIQMVEAAIGWIKTETKPDGQTNMVKKKAKRTDYRWTGDITELVEAGYAFAEAGSVNNGEVEITDFICSLGDTFNIKIERCSDFYYKMRTRSGSRTAFLDKLKKRLEARMDRDDERRYRR